MRRRDPMHPKAVHYRKERQRREQEMVKSAGGVLTLEPPKIKAGAWASSIKAVVASYNTCDRDRDLILPGALLNGPDDLVIVSSWNHSAAPPRDKEGRVTGPAKEAPVGVARLWEEDNRLWADVMLDDTPQGRATCERIARDRPDWSVAYDFDDRLKDTRVPTVPERERGAYRTILKWRIIEVSPVTQGAAIASGTYEACCGSCANVPKSLKPLRDARPEEFSPDWVLFGKDGPDGDCGCGCGGGCTGKVPPRNPYVSGFVGSNNLNE